MVTVCLGFWNSLNFKKLYLLLQYTIGLEVEQSPSALSLQEGAGAALKCNFSQAVNSVQWFRQNPGGGSLTRLISVASGIKQSGRLNCTLNTRERSSTLHITASQLEDAASYLCAVETQWPPGVCACFGLAGASTSANGCCIAVLFIIANLEVGRVSFNK
uniref:Ig-like domain-containing protein n=1 Tax=Ailuropoda melanoleuca TaxID=9646 RepID=A0A7N5KTJ8_AILME